MPSTTPGLGQLAHPALCGELVSLRPVIPTDADGPFRLREERPPTSRAADRAWISDVASADAQPLAIVRRRDDGVIGSLTRTTRLFSTELTARSDPTAGSLAEPATAEAMCLVTGWLLDDGGEGAVLVRISKRRQETIRQLTTGGFRETARLRDQLAEGGGRAEELLLQACAPGWIARLGDPMLTPLGRTGTCVARPVPPAAGPPPANAVMVGERVFLRPMATDDARIEADALWRETEDSYGTGRWLAPPSELLRFYRRLINDEEPRRRWLQVCLRADNQPIDHVGLSDFDLVHRTASTDSGFHEAAYGGTGYGFEAKHLILAYAFDVLGLHKVWSFVNFHTTRSAAARRKQGDTECGRICWVCSSSDGPSHWTVFELLADHWRAVPRAAAREGGHHA